MTTPHIDDLVPDLLVRPPDDLSRVAALAHTKHCQTCAAAWRETEDLFETLQAAAVLPLPAPAALARARAYLPLPLPTTAWARPLLMGLAIALVGAVPIALAPAPLAAKAAAGALALVAGALGGWGVLRPRRTWILPVVSLGMALLFGHRWPLPADVLHSLKCAGMELVMSALPTSLFLLSGKLARSPRLPSLVAVAVAGGGAMAGQAALHLRCPMETSLSHQLIFHVLPVLIAMATASALFRRNEARARIVGPRP